MSNSEPWLDEYSGARWVRVDFHLHTPGVDSFKCPGGLDPKRPEQKTQIVRQYVEKLVEGEIQIAGIADYNGIREDWFIPIKEEAATFGILVLPGAELDFEDGKYGLHILAVFPSDSDVAALNRAIDSLDKNPSDLLRKSDGHHRNIVPRQGVENALQEIRRQFEPIVIVAHPNQQKGLFKTHDSEASVRFLLDARPDAIESLDLADIERLASTGLVPRRELENVASVEFSDPKSLDEIGSKKRPGGLARATYLKLSDTTHLEAIRLALHDPHIRVCVGEAAQPYYTRFLAMEVQGSGFLGDLRVVLAPELNVLIGGRGVGKSAVLEVMRYALDLKPYAPTEYRVELVRYALGSGGKVSLYLEQVIDSQVRRTYRVDRILAEAPRVFELDPLAAEREVELPPTAVLGDRELPLFFGQREIYEVTRNEPQRLRLLDEIIGRKAREQQRSVRKLEDGLRRNARSILDLETKLIEKEETENRLKRIANEIEMYRRVGLVEKLRSATLLGQDEERLNNMVEVLPQLETHWQDVAEEMKVLLRRAANQAKRAQSENKAILEKAGRELEILLDSFEKLFQQGASYLSARRDRLATLLEDWKEARRPLDHEIRGIKQDLDSETLDPDRLDILSREQTRLETKMDTLDAIEKQRDEEQQRRKKLLGGLRDTRHQVFELRRKQAQELSDQLLGSVRVSVEYKGLTHEFANAVGALLQGSRLDRTTIREKICSVEGQHIDGQDIATAVREGIDSLAEKFDLTPGRASQLHAYLTQDPARLYQMELLVPDDQMQVFLKLNESEFPLKRLSDGQRATAMLMLLLVQRERLLIVDQPEDDLDNRFIYEDIVRILRDQKGQRQVIAATHNPNIPVLGDAELIVVLEASDHKAYTSEQGSLDRAKVRDAVKQIMEGGEEAFRRRAEKYGWIA